MTTPTPTRELLEGLAGALRRAAYHKGKRLAIVENCFCGSCPALVLDCDRWAKVYPNRCDGPAARAALAAWERRGRLSDDRFLDTLVYDELTAEDGAPLGERIRRLLINLDSALFGTGPHGAEAAIPPSRTGAGERGGRG